RRLSLPDSAATEFYTLSLHDALPICPGRAPGGAGCGAASPGAPPDRLRAGPAGGRRGAPAGLARGTHPAGPAVGSDDAPQQLERSEEHTSELQSRENLVCRLLLEKKK